MKIYISGTEGDMTPVHPSIHHSSQLSGILSRIVGHSILNNSLNNSNTLIIEITLVIMVSSVNHRYQSCVPKGDIILDNFELYFISPTTKTLSIIQALNYSVSHY